MKKVWLIHNNIPPYRVPLFTEIARAAPFDFTVVLTAPVCRHRPNWRVETNLLPFRVAVTRGLNVPVSDSSSISVAGALPFSLLRGRPDIVICSGFGLSTLIVFLWARLFGGRYIVWSEATPITEQLRRMGRVRQSLRRLVARHASAFIDAGTLARDYIRSLLPTASQTPFFRSYNCVDSSIFASDSPGGDGDRAGQGRRRILFVGRLNENKGIPMLLDVFEDLQEESSDRVGLVLAGDGPLRGRVEEFRRNHPSVHIEMAGQVPYEQVVRYYRECDVLVLLSLSDCNPLVIFEALHSGIPIVCTDRAGNAPDFIQPGQNGYIVNPLDRKSIVACLHDVLRWDTDKRRNAACISRRLVAPADYTVAAQAFIDACSSV
jgi:glycosyltransferase involved in cell wall biosynthesis